MRYVIKYKGKYMRSDGYLVENIEDGAQYKTVSSAKSSRTHHARSNALHPNEHKIGITDPAWICSIKIVIDYVDRVVPTGTV